MSEKTSRRHFLLGRTLAPTVEHVIQGTGLIGDLWPDSREAEIPSTGSDWPLMKIGRPAMACEFEVSLNRGEYPQGIEAAMAALDEIERLENRLSVFRPGSEVCDLNAAAGKQPVQVSGELFSLLSRCQEFSRMTDGAVDVTSSPLWRLWGFSRRSGKIPASDEITRTRQYVGWRHLTLDDSARTVAFERPGMEISFGCAGKGFALDSASEQLEEAGIGNYLFHGGLSSILARGTRFPSEKNNGWTVGIADPVRPGRRLAEIRLCNEALGTSGSQSQFFYHKGRRYPHIIDPRTGFPADKALMVTVAAPHAATADMLSTAFFVAGPEKAEEYCHAHPGTAAFFVLPEDRKNGVRLQHFGFREGRLFLRPPE
ncbi:MAG: FAD:protein FMN transferase [Planctomycetaceae bacterium]|jgi:thiamine biosynthesis lipoprotein|nr:FAD:protein FMN transferase [Planctomycetaceae bacterium]